LRDNREMAHPARFSLALAFLSVTSLSWADRLILIPTGNKLRFGQVRTEFMWSTRDRDHVQGFLGAGIGHSFDAELLYENLSPNAQIGSFNFAYNYVVPVTDLTPGLSVGVRDALNKTRDGRSIYVATTFRIAPDGLYNENSPPELTLGFGTESLRGLFVGASLPFTDHFRLLAEHDSFRMTAGFEMKPLPGLALRMLYRQDETLLSVAYSVRF